MGLSGPFLNVSWGLIAQKRVFRHLSPTREVTVSPLRERRDGQQAWVGIERACGSRAGGSCTTKAKLSSCSTNVRQAVKGCGNKANHV